MVEKSCFLLLGPCLYIELFDCLNNRKCSKCDKFSMLDKWNIKPP